MPIRSRWAATSILCSFLFAALSTAQEKPPTKTGGDKPDGPLVPKPTVKVEKGRLAASVTAKAVVESDATTEISVRLKTWSSPLIVQQAAKHGSRVKKGDLLLIFDVEKIALAVRDALEDRVLARLTIKLAELELPLVKQQLPLDLAAAERERKQTIDDLKHFLDVDKPHQIEEAQFALKSSEFSAQTAKDELAQLQKMYRDKDLTEETEQLILKRYKFGLESAEFALRGARLRTEHTLSSELPRREEATKLAATKAEMAWERAREQLPIQVVQKELALDKLRFDADRAQEKLTDLKQDESLMTSITAPVDGVVYHGRYAHGQWTAPPATAYLRNGTLPVNDVVLTIVSNGRLFLFAEVEEKEIGDLKVGQAARFTPTRFPHRKLNGKVHRVAPVPQGGKFEVLVALTDESPDGIVPGLTGSVKLVTSQKENALTVPSSAVFEDPDTDSYYVYLAGKTQKKTVKIGLVAGDKTEIVEGLAEGDEILSAKP